MPPIGNRKTSDARARAGWELRCKGRTWQEVADEVTPPFRSRQAAQKAVQTWLWRNPQDDLETMRRATGDRLVGMTVKMANAAEEAIEAGKYRDAAELGKVVIDGLEKHAKLTGQHVVVPKETNVNVQVGTTVEVLAELRTRLAAAIDAEVIELPAPAPDAQPDMLPAVIDAEVVEEREQA